MNDLPTKLNFEILALDTSDNASITSELDLLYLFRSCGELWENASLDEQNLIITDGDASVEVQKVNSDVGVNKTFLIKVIGKYDWLEPKRWFFLELLYNNKFDDLYITLDDISKTMGHQLYPLLYELENALRAYLTKFMTTKVSHEWFNNTEPKLKIYGKNSDRQLINDTIYSLNFDRLGEIIYNSSSHKLKNNEIIDQLDEIKKNDNLEKIREDIETIQDRLKNNYDKFFRTYFKGFQNKWQEMYEIRNKVAHHKLLTVDDFDKGKKLYEELITMITTATKELNNLILPLEEKENIENQYDQFMFVILNACQEGAKIDRRSKK